MSISSDGRYDYANHNSHPQGGISDPLILHRIAVMNDGYGTSGPPGSYSSQFGGRSWNFSGGGGYGGDFPGRIDIDAECGYPGSDTFINVQYYRMLYDRENIATRVVEVWPMETWQSQPTIYECEDPKIVTPFEAKWDTISSDIAGTPSWYLNEQGGNIYEKLLRADIISGIGHFGIILLGINDGKNFQEPVDGSIMAVNSRVENGKLVTYPDCYMTAEEEEMIQNATFYSPQEVEIGGKKLTINGKPLNSQEKATLTRERAYRDKMLAKLNAKSPKQFSEQSKKVQTQYPRDMPQDQSYLKGHPLIEGSDLNYEPGSAVGMPAPAAFGGSVGYAMSGTDQQYFGVISGTSEEFAPKPTKPNTIQFLMPYPEDLVQIVRYEWNIRNPRFGLPVMYRVTLNDPREVHSGIGLPLATVFVHWSRIVHIADNLRTSAIFGVPRMRPVLNRILDLRKLYAGGAEGTWKGISPGLAFETHPQLGGDVIVDDQAMRQTMLDYQNSLQRYLIAKGGSFKPITGQMIDPSAIIEKNIESICITGGYPVRVFKGSERGELASSQDDSKFNDRLIHRMNYQCTPYLLTPVVDRLIQVGVLPVPSYEADKSTAAEQIQNLRKKAKRGEIKVNRVYKGTIIRNEENGEQRYMSDTGYSIKWPDIDSTTEKDKAGIIAQKTTALVAYANSPAPTLMPPHNYFTEVWAMEDDVVETMLDNALASQDDPLSQMLSEERKPPALPGFEGEGEDPNADPSADPNDPAPAEEEIPSDEEIDEEPVANEWSDAAREAALEARRAKGLATDKPFTSKERREAKLAIAPKSNQVQKSFAEKHPEHTDSKGKLTEKVKNTIHTIHAVAFTKAVELHELIGSAGEKVLDFLAEQSFGDKAIMDPVKLHTGIGRELAVKIGAHVLTHAAKYVSTGIKKLAGNQAYIMNITASKQREESLRILDEMFNDFAKAAGVDRNVFPSKSIIEKILDSIHIPEAEIQVGNGEFGDNEDLPIAEEV